MGDQIDKPILAGRCARELRRGVVCGRSIYKDTDYEFIRANYLICEPCVDDLLTPVIVDRDSLGRMNNGKGGSDSSKGHAWRNYPRPSWEKK